MSSKCHATGEQNPRTELFFSNPQRETISRQEKMHCTLSCSSPSWANSPADASLGMGLCFQASGTHTLQLLGQGNRSHHAHMWKSTSELSVSVCLPECTGSLTPWNHCNVYSIRLALWHDFLTVVLGSSDGCGSSRMLALTTCCHIPFRHTERTVAIFKKRKSSTNRIGLVLIHKNLDLAVLLLCAYHCRCSVQVIRDFTQCILTCVQNQAPWKNVKVVTINLPQPVTLKILLSVLSSWCASAIARFPHSKNNIAVFLHIKHNNGATLPWLEAIVKQISLLYIITSLSKQAATQSSLIFLKFNWNLTVLQTLRIL